MNKYFCCMGLVIALAGAGRMEAQSALPSPPPIPESPLVLPMPENVHVIITVQDKTKRDPASPPPSAATSAKSIDITKTGSTSWIVLTTREGKATGYWILDGFIYTRGADGKRVDRDVYDYTLPLCLRPDGRNFYGVEGVSMDRYKGIFPWNGALCYYYEQGPPPKPEVPPPRVEPGLQPTPFTGGEKVWIDTTTKLPVAAMLPEGLCTYTFLPPPQVPLDPPPDFVKLSEYMKAMSARMQKEAAIR